MLFQASNLVWPFTMNYAWNQTDCVNCDEPITTVETLWQIPLHEWTYPNGRAICHSLKSTERDRKRAFFRTNGAKHCCYRRCQMRPSAFSLINSNIEQMKSAWRFLLHHDFDWSRCLFLATRSCRTLSDPSCLPEDQPHSGDLLFDLLKYNFDRHAASYRSPFVIELDLFWLSEKKEHRLEALIRFIDYILNSEEYGYAYFVSIEQALEWLKYPRRLTELQDFWAFSCRDTLYEYDIDCSRHGSKTEKNFIDSNEEAQRLLAENRSNGTDAPPMDRRAEELFRSGIVVHSIWVFLLLIITVLFYDKYFASKWAFSPSCVILGSIRIFILPFFSHYSTINFWKKKQPTNRSFS